MRTFIICLATTGVTTAVATPRAHAWDSDYNVSVTGRCLTNDGAPIPHARVEARDDDMFPHALDIVGPLAVDASGNDVCATGLSGADGRFALSGSCGDYAITESMSKPDIYVRCMLEGPAGRIFEPNSPWTLYNGTSAQRDDSAAAYNVGDVKIQNGAGKTFISLNETVQKLESLLGTTLTAAWTLYPGGREATIQNTGQTYWASYAGAIFMSISAGDETNGTVAHEYGHTLQFQALMADWSSFQSFLNAFRAGAQNLAFTTGSGHTFSTVTNPVMAFSEGWAEFIEKVVYGTGAPKCSTWKERGATEADKIQVEGNVACRLWRLYKKWGLGDIWTAEKASKATRYDHFIAEFGRTHADAVAVALGTATTPTPAPDAGTNNPRPDAGADAGTRPDAGADAGSVTDAGAGTAVDAGAAAETDAGTGAVTPTTPEGPPAPPVTPAEPPRADRATPRTTQNAESPDAGCAIGATTSTRSTLLGFALAVGLLALVRRRARKVSAARVP